MSSFIPISMVGDTSTFSVPIIDGYLSSNSVNTSLYNGFVNVAVRNSNKSSGMVISLGSL